MVYNTNANRHNNTVLILNACSVDIRNAIIILTVGDRIDRKEGEYTETPIMHIPL